MTPTTAVTPLHRVRRFVAEETQATGLPIARLLLVAAVIHVLVTWFAVAPWQLDEHFQILEFAYARAGLAPVSNLAWEYEARIRSTLQPTLALGLLCALRSVGILSPFVWIRLLRFGTLGVAFAVLLRVFSRVSPTLAPAGRRALWLVGLLVCFAPLFTSRFTSENLGGLTLATALTFVRQEDRAKDRWWIGTFLGLAFVFRFQTAFASGALLCWIFWYGTNGLRRVVWIVGAAGAVVGVGVLVDHWFYGVWVLTPWEYFRVNLVQGVAAQMGTTPWYGYLVWLTTMVPPLGFVLFALACIGVACNRRSPWSWTSAAFLLGHMAVAHKEPRFLFPLLYTFPVCVAMGWDVLARRVRTDGWPRWVIRALVVENVLVLLFLATPWGHGVEDFDWYYFRFLWHAADARPGETLYVLTAERSPYSLRVGIPLVFSHPRVRGVPYIPGAPLPAAIPGGTPAADILVVTRIPAVPSIAGASGYTLLYESEPGYRTMARWLGLANSRWIPGLNVDEWWQGGRRVYRLVVAE